MTDTNEISENQAREALGIKQDEWIITVDDQKLAVMKAALKLHADAAKELFEEIDGIGS